MPFDEYGAIAYGLGTFYLLISAIEYKTIVTGYLHYVDKDDIMFFSRAVVYTLIIVCAQNAGTSLYYLIHFHLENIFGHF